MNGLISDNVFPEEYDISLDIDMFKWVFKGKETITMNVGEKVKRVSMNAAGLFISKAVSGRQNAKIAMNVAEEIVHFDFDDYLQRGSNELVVSFKGVVNTDLKGLYRSLVTDRTGKTIRIAVTQFEPSNARTCFPCWDAPHVKAAFRLTITTSDNFDVLSNMPVLSRVLLSNGRIRVSFLPSPQMSTYVFGFVVGHFSTVEKVLPGNLRIRVNATTSGMPEGGLFAMNLAVKALTYCQDYFGINYPLPKLDLVALPELSPDGMEHWGLITFRETSLLINPECASPQARKSVTLIICHEIAHQWFGNLVTMRSWKDLWLNEGFANFLMYKCAMACVPDLVDSTEFVVRELSQALEEDALLSTHSLQSHESLSAEEVLGTFDAVSYCKGAALIWMLHDFLGADVFRQCLHGYLTQFKFSCASSADLWAAFTRGSGQPLESMLRSWISNAGYPVVSVSVKNRQLTLKQQQFLADGTPGPPDKIWCVPITIATSEQPQVMAKRFLLSSKESTEALGDILNDPSFKLNIRTTGVYRVLYERSLLKSVMACADKYSVNDRIGLMDDLFALARAGHIPTRWALEHSLALLNETNANFWRCFDDCVMSIQALNAHSEGSGAAFQAFVLRVFGPLFDRLGWSSGSGSGARSVDDSFLRPLVILRLGTAGHAGVLRTVRMRFWRHVRGDASIAPELQWAVLASALSQGGVKELNAVLELFRQATGQQSDRITQALGFVAPSLLNRVFDFALHSRMRTQQRLGILQSCAVATPESRHHTWDFVRRQWDDLTALSDGLFGIGDFIMSVCFGLVGHKHLNEMENFFQAHEIDSPSAIRKCLENVKVTTAQRDRDADDVLAFFKQFLPKGRKRKRK